MHTSILAFSAFLVMATTARAQYVNDWDKPFNFRCPAGQIIAFISSVHENIYEDRRWEFYCRTVRINQECSTSGYVNEFDKPVVFSCPGEGVLVGVESYNDDFFRDRRFKFTCCNVVMTVSTDCYVTPEINKFDEKMTLFVPEGQAIKGMYSWHDNYFEDRCWQAKLCKI